jgi:hypothetical protein
MVSIVKRFFTIITKIQVFAIENEFRRKENLVIQLHQEGKTQRDIAKTAHMSVRDISKIIRKIEGIPEEKSLETQVLDLFYQDKKAYRSRY